VCYSAQCKDPLSIAYRLEDESSGMPYLIATYVTWIDFLFLINILTAITKVTEPKYYNEAIKDPRWRKAIKEEI